MLVYVDAVVHERRDVEVEDLLVADRVGVTPKASSGR